MLLLLGVYFLTTGASHTLQGNTVIIKSVSGATLTLDVNQDRTLEVEGLLGKTKIRIGNGAVWFISSPCPHHLCVDRGKIERAGEWIACLPNGVAARLSGQADYDGITP